MALSRAVEIDASQQQQCRMSVACYTSLQSHMLRNPVKTVLIRIVDEAGEIVAVAFLEDRCTAYTQDVYVAYTHALEIAAAFHGLGTHMGVPHEENDWDTSLYNCQMGQMPFPDVRGWHGFKFSKAVRNQMTVYVKRNATTSAEETTQIERQFEALQEQWGHKRFTPKARSINEEMVLSFHFSEDHP